MGLEGKIVLITGSSLGIGRETAFLFAKEKARPIITYYKDRKDGEEVLKKIKEMGIDTNLYYLNLADEESIVSFVNKVKKDFGRIDILVNNAGVIYWKPLKETSFKEIDEQIDVNLKGLIKMTKITLEELDPSLIINISSGAGKTGYATLATYCATKFGVRGFSEALRKEISIPVVVINPRSTKTRMTNFRGDSPEKVGELIVKAAKGEINEDEIDVWNYI